MDKYWATQQEVSGQPLREASSVFTGIPHHSPITPRGSLLDAEKQAQGCHWSCIVVSYIIIWCVVMITETKYTINLMHLNHPKTNFPRLSPWNNCLSRNPNLVPKSLEVTILNNCLNSTLQTDCNECTQLAMNHEILVIIISISYLVYALCKDHRCTMGCSFYIKYEYVITLL